MQLAIGNKVVYRGRGPCLIGAIVQKVIGGSSTSFYRLALLDDSSGELFVPVDNRDDLQIRELLQRSEIPKLLGRLGTRADAYEGGASAKNRRQRSLEISKLFCSGSAFDLAQVIESLTQLNDSKALAPAERQMLNRARTLLTCEISEVMNESKSAAEARINGALEARRDRNGRSGPRA